jgi:hypothetical protein
MSIEKNIIYLVMVRLRKIERVGFNVVYLNLISVKRDEYLSMIGIEDVK